VWLLAREPLVPALEAAAAGEDVAFGVSSASDDVPLGQAVEEAVVAARLGAEAGAADRALLTEYVRVYAYAALRLDPVGLARSHAALLAPITSQPLLLKTLRQYFATNRSVSKTAALVHRHRQSVIYRLRRAAELLAIDLDDAEAMFRIEAALRTMPEDSGADAMGQGA
jgi:DNA-binding PucR family transcriptional regulator